MFPHICGWQFKFMEKSERFSVPRILSMFSDSLAGFTRLSIQLYSQLWFITKECETKSVKREKCMEQSSKGTTANFQYFSPSGVPQDTLNSFNSLWQHVWNVIYQGSLLDTQCPRFEGDWGSFCLACTKIRDSQKEKKY